MESHLSCINLYGKMKIFQIKLQLSEFIRKIAHNIMLLTMQIENINKTKPEVCQARHIGAMMGHSNLP